MSDKSSYAPIPGLPANTSPIDEIEKAAISTASTADFPFTAGEILNHFRLAKRFPSTYFTVLEETRHRAKEFAERYIKPNAVELEKKIGRDPTYFDWDLMRKACNYRFFSMLIPQEFDGLGCYSLQMAAMVEELAVGCGGSASTIGVHSAGISCGLISLDPYILEKYIRPTAQAEMRGEPILWGGGVTEPAAGTDIWDEDFLDQARIMTTAKKVSDGYVLNGRKCFISNGSVAKYLVVTAALDPKHILDSWTTFLVPADTKGFSVGRIERKMGQKSSPASELIFEDMFLPKELMLGGEGQGARAVTIYLAGSRGPVGAIGTGTARRALQCLIDWAKQKKTARGRLIDQQAFQLVVARMTREIVEARAAYVAAALACDEIFLKILSDKRIVLMLSAVPGKYFLNPSVVKIAKSNMVKNITYKILSGSATPDRLAQTSSLATIAKIKGSSVGVNVSGEAARIMGPDCADPRWPVEKCWRDAKLTQIYEGTNPANAITLFKEHRPHMEAIMDTYYSPELKPLVETAERFAVKEILGKVVHLESLEKPEFPWEAVRAAGEAGFLCGPLDEDHGGSNLDLPAIATLIEKLAEGAAGPATIFAAHLAAVATISVGAPLAAPLIEMAQHMTDPQPFLIGVALPMTAVPLNRPAIPIVGQSNITGDFICLPAPHVCRNILLVTGEHNSQAFCVAAENLKTFTTPIYPGSGLDEFPSAGLKLDDLKITGPISYTSLAAVLWKNIRVLLAAVQVGNARAASKTAWEYAQERIQTGRKIIEHQDVRRVLECMSEQVDVSLAMVRLAAGAPDGETASRLARHAYTFCGTAGEQVCLDAVQTLGGYGYMKDYGLEKRLRDSKSLQCLLGTHPEDMLGGFQDLLGVK